MQTKQFWNRKYLQSPVLYNGRAVVLNDGRTVKQTLPYAIDVRQFIQTPNFILEKIVKDEGIWMMSSHEDKALACLRYVRKHIQYTPDKTSFGLNELWTFPGETLTLGRGDCVEANEPIICIDEAGDYAIIPIKDLKGFKGKVMSYDFVEQKYVFKPIVNFWDKGKKEVADVLLRNGCRAKLTPDHKMILAKKVYDPQKIHTSVERLKDINLNDFEQCKSAIIRKIPFGTKTEDFDLLYAIGAFVAEGWLDNQHPNDVFIANDGDTWLKRRVIEFCKNKNLPYYNHFKYVAIRLKDHPRLKSMFDECGAISPEKKFPNWCLSLNEDCLASLMHGYMDGDTYKNARQKGSNRVLVHNTVSNILAMQLRIIHWIWGRPLFSWLCKKHGGVGTKPIWRLSENRKSAFAKPRFGETASCVGIAEITPAGEEHVYDIEVKDTHNFVLANSGLIVHNCEDMSILVASLMRNAGVPAYRIKVAAGWVVAGKNAPLGGHAYPIFLRKDEEWVTLDPCYYPNDLPVSQRVPVKNDPNYKDVWFTFNDEYSWANKPVTVIKTVTAPTNNISGN